MALAAATAALFYRIGRASELGDQTSGGEALSTLSYDAEKAAD